MTSFVESATLKVNDQSSGAINKINAELKKLFSTARSLKSLKLDIQVNDKGIQSAIRNMRSLRNEMNRLGVGGRGGTIKLNVAVNTSGLAAAQRQLNQLRTQAQRPITTPAPRTAPRAAAVTPGGIRGIPGPAQFPGGRGFISGLGMGFGGVVVGLSAVEAAGFAAAAALKSVAQAAASRDRTMLQMNVLASEAQRKVFDAMPQPKDMPLPLSTDQYNQLRTSLLGDVQGDERQRAQAASVVTEALVRDYIPRLFAQDPTKSKAEVLEGVRQLVKGINLASTELTTTVTDKKTGVERQEFSKEGQRVMNAAIRAMSVDPEVTPQLIKTVLANAKTAALTLNEEGLTRLLLNAGARGQRAGNEAFRAIMAGTGTIDNKSLNEGLVKMGLFTKEGDALIRKPISKARAKRGEKGAIVPGANEPIGGWKMWQENPAQAFRDYFVPKMIEDLVGKDKGAAAGRAARDEFVKANKEQQIETERAREESRRTGKYVEPRRIPGAELTGDQGILTPSQIQSYMVGMFPSMNAAARQGIFDLITGFDQMFSTLNQSAVGQFQSVPDAVKQSWTAAAENVQTAWTNAAAQFGSALAKYLNLPEKTQAAADWITEHPNAAVGTAITGGAAVVGGVGYAVTRWLAAKGIATGAAATGAAVTGAAGAAPTTAAGTAAAATAGGVLSRVLPFALKRIALPVGFLLDMMGELGGPSNLAQLERIREANQAYVDSTLQMQQAQEKLKTATDPAEIATLSSTIETMKQRIAAAEEILKTSGSQAVQRAQDQRDAAVELPPVDVAAKMLEQPDWVPLQVEQPDWIPLQVEQPSWLSDLFKPDATAIEAWKSEIAKLQAEGASAAQVAAAQAELDRVQRVPAEGPLAGIDLSGVVDRFGTSIGELSSASSTFSAVFSGGALAIVSAGESAISAMQGGASGVGSAIGSAALSVIQGASINVNVNANVTGGNKVDTGDSKAAN